MKESKGSEDTVGSSDPTPVGAEDDKSVSEASNSPDRADDHKDRMLSVATTVSVDLLRSLARNSAVADDMGLADTVPAVQDSVPTLWPEQRELIRRAISALNAQRDSVQDFREWASKANHHARVAESLEVLTWESRVQWPCRLVRKSLREQVLACIDLKQDHPALSGVKCIADDLKRESEKLMSIAAKASKRMIEVSETYYDWISAMVGSTIDDRVKLLEEPVSIFAPELGFYNISQESALSLTGHDRFGMRLETAYKHTGTHSVVRKENVFFKCSNSRQGLDHCFEEAVFAFSKLLHNDGGNKGTELPDEKEESSPEENFSTVVPSCFLVLKNVATLNLPEDDPDSLVIRGRLNKARAEGMSMEEYLVKYPADESKFVQAHELSEYFLQVTAGVKGESLEAEIEKATEKSPLKLNPVSFGMLVVLSLVLGPADGKPDNYMVTSDRNIVSIDNDMILQRFIVSHMKEHFLGVKCCLLILRQMETYIPEVVLSKIQSISAEVLVMKWAYHLVLYSKLLEKADLNDLSKESLFFPTKLLPGTFKFVSQQLSELVLSTTKYPLTTYAQLFALLHPVAAFAYKHYLMTLDGDWMQIYKSIHESKVPSIDKFADSTINKILKANVAPAESAYYDLRSVSIQDDFFSYIASIDLSRISPENQCSIVPILAKLAQIWCPLPVEVDWNRWLSNEVIEALFNPSLEKQTILFVLEKRGQIINDKFGSEGNSLLHLAVKKKCSYEVLSALLEINIFDLNQKNARGDTPLSLALFNYDENAFSLLISRGSYACSVSGALKFFQKLRDRMDLSGALAKFELLCKLNIEIRWRIAIEVILPSMTRLAEYPESWKIFGTESVDRLLPKDIREVIIDEKGVPRRMNVNGNQTVAWVEKHGFQLFFKFFPELPGVEAAVNWLGRKLVIHGMTMSELFSFDLPGTGHVPVLVSLGIPGSTFYDALKDATAEESASISANLDFDNVSSHIVLAMLTNPEDGKPDNFILEPVEEETLCSSPKRDQSDGKTEFPPLPEEIKKIDEVELKSISKSSSKKCRLVSIDNDHSFVTAVSKKDVSFLQSLKKGLLSMSGTRPAGSVQVRSVLFCLDQMRMPISEKVRELLVNIEPFELLSQWLNFLIKTDRSYCALFDNVEYLSTLIADHNSFLGIPVRPKSVFYLYDKLIRMKQILLKSPNLTHVQLLSRIEPLVFKRYFKFWSMDAPILDRFLVADGENYGVIDKKKGMVTLSRSGRILEAQSIPFSLKTVKMIHQDQDFSPTAALKELKAAMNDEKLPIDSLTDTQFSKRLEKLDFSTLSKIEQQLYFQSLSRSVNKRCLLGSITIVGAELEKSVEIFKPWTFELIEVLDLRKCKSVSDVLLERISKEALHLLELNLFGVKGLTKAVQLSSRTEELQPLVFPNLRFLVLSKNAELSLVSIAAPELTVLEMASCRQLVKAIVLAPQLRKLNLRKCYRLMDDSLCQIVSQATGLVKFNVHDCLSLQFHRHMWDPKPEVVNLKSVPFLVDDKHLIASFDLQKRFKHDYKELLAIDLTSCNLGFEGASILASFSCQWPNLICLNLKGNKISGKGLLRLLEISHLRVLNVLSNSFETEIVTKSTIQDALNLNENCQLCFVRISSEVLPSELGPSQWLEFTRKSGDKVYFADSPGDFAAFDTMSDGCVWDTLQKYWLSGVQDYVVTYGEGYELCGLLIKELGCTVWLHNSFGHLAALSSVEHYSGCVFTALVSDDPDEKVKEDLRNRLLSSFESYMAGSQTSAIVLVVGSVASEAKDVEKKSLPSDAASAPLQETPLALSLKSKVHPSMQNDVYLFDDSCRSTWLKAFIRIRFKTVLAKKGFLG